VAACSHLDQVRIVAPPEEIAGCEECLKIGSGWVHLREGHPIAHSVESGEGWSWCYLDPLMFQLSAE